MNGKRVPHLICKDSESFGFNYFSKLKKNSIRSLLQRGFNYYEETLLLIHDEGKPLHKSPFSKPVIGQDILLFFLSSPFIKNALAHLSGI